MSEAKIDPIDSSQFKNGDNIHFDYNNDSNHSSSINNSSTTTSGKKKKKKKNKHKNKISVDNIQATLNNPEEDYPTSRVIKQAPNGDVIVETLDDDEGDNDYKHHAHPRSANIWDNSTVEEQENLKLFWESLDESQKMELVKIDKKSIMEIFRNEVKASTSQNHNSSTSNANQSGSLNNNGCTCSYCGRKNNIIEDELENIYDNHFDDIIDFIHEVRDINDLNALPGLLFGGFHMLEEEHKLQKRQQRQKHKQVASHSHNHSHSYNHSHTHDNSHDHHDEHNHSLLNQCDHTPSHYNQVEEIQEEVEVEEEIKRDESIESLEVSNEQKAFHKLLDPKLFEALENLDFEKMKDASANNNSSNLLEKAGSLREIIRDLHKADKVQLEKGMAFLQNMGKIFANDVNNKSNNELNDQLSQGLSSFAEDLLKNDGHSFIDMMESLSESRTAREDLLKEKPSNEQAWVDEDDNSSNVHKPNFDQDQEYYEEYEGQEVDEEEEEAEEEDEEDDDDDQEEEEDDDEDGNGESDTESEISEEEKMQEIRRLFLIQVIKLFQERLKNAYKEKLSQDRTKKLIEELEAEENAKKERELKKLKQKEKAKEKKRLQQLAKEEERKRKEEEQRAKEEELRLKQESLRAEQKRKKEEAKQKREEEKRKRIEELKRKEEEQRKRTEAQRKKEEEAKRLKEERKKKAEEERKKKEEEKKQKELAKKQREEERERLRKEKEKAEEEEAKLAKQTEQLSISNESEQITGIRFGEIGKTLANGHIEEQKTRSPTKNHILEQLYQAKPGSLSSTTSSTPIPTQYLTDTAPMIPSVLSPSSSNILPNTLLTNNNVSPSSGTSILGSPWGTTNTLNTQSVYPNQFSTPSTFSPFNGFNGTENVPLNTTNGLTSSVWNPTSTSRNNSIWSNSTTGSFWNNSVANNPAVVPDTDLIQTATYNAFQLLQNSNQLEFGVAPSMKLFQNTKTLLVNNNLTLNQFLGACRTSSNYRFDFIYDDFGTVTHIKVSLIAPTQPVRASPPGLSNGTPPITGLNKNAESASLLQGFGDISNTNNAFNNVRGLWN